MIICILIVINCSLLQFSKCPGPYGNVYFNVINLSTLVNTCIITKCFCYHKVGSTQLVVAQDVKALGYWSEDQLFKPQLHQLAKWPGLLELQPPKNGVCAVMYSTCATMYMWQIKAVRNISLCGHIKISPSMEVMESNPVPARLLFIKLRVCQSWCGELHDRISCQTLVISRAVIAE